MIVLQAGRSVVLCGALESSYSIEVVGSFFRR